MLDETVTTSESSGNAYMMILQASDLPFVSLSKSNTLNSWKLHELQVYDIITPPHICINFLDTLYPMAYILFYDLGWTNFVQFTPLHGITEFEIGKEVSLHATYYTVCLSEHQN